MRPILAIARREVLACFRTPLGWVAMALYLLVAGLWVGMETLRPGEPASLRAFFGVSQWLLLTVAPAISMRLIAEELRHSTIEPLVTAPISDYQIALGKYFGGVGFLLILLLPTLAYVIVLEAVSRPDYGPIIAGYLGLILTGMLYIATGLFFSSLTSSQVVAFLATLIFFFLLHIISERGPAIVGEEWGRWLYQLSIARRLGDFAKGVIDTAHITAFVCASAWFVFLTGITLETRRWR